MSELALKDLVVELGSTFEKFKSANDERMKQIESKGSADADLVEKFQRIETGMDELLAMKERLENVEVELDRPGGGGHVTELQAANDAHQKSFEAWIRDPRDHQKASELKSAEKAAYSERVKELGAKAVTVGTATAGGHAVFEDLDTKIAAKVLDMSPIRQHALVEQTSTGDYKKLVDVGGAASGWAAETTTRSDKGTPTLEEVTPTFGELYAYPKASEWSLDDMFFNVQAWLIDSISKEFAYQEGEAFATGNGTNKPTGFLDGTPVVGADEGASPTRAFGILQYIASGTAAAFVNGPTASPLLYAGDKLIDTVYALKSFYRANARWMMNKSSLQTVRKFKDVDGNYIWSPGLIAGQPDQLLGYPVSEMEAMPDIAADSLSIAFGDFKEGYVVVDRTGMRVTVDPYTVPGHIVFYVRKRLGGILYNDDAIKLIKMAAS